jgi:SSS family solute:Na+ symporter
LKESRFGLLFNGFVKIPMQFLVLAVGVMVFVFFQFNPTPLHFNQVNRDALVGTAQEQAFVQLERSNDSLFAQKQQILSQVTTDFKAGADQIPLAAQDQLRLLETQRDTLRVKAEQLIKQAAPGKDPKDKDFVFINFVLQHIPTGLIGLMLAMIFCASWSTTASELSALTATSISDIYRRSFVKDRDDTHYFRMSRWFTIGWGGFIVVFATYADLFDNLIQAVNMIGSVFYGTILGIFFTAFFLKSVQGKAVFWAAVIAQSIVVYLFFFVDKNAYLWYNPLGCGMVMGVGWLLQFFQIKSKSRISRISNSLTRLNRSLIV